MSTRIKRDTFYNAHMAEGLKGYDGAVDGVKILHGIAVAEHLGQLVGQEDRSQRVSEDRQPKEAVDIRPVVHRAVEVIGDPEEAMRWLGAPVRALDYATPISRLYDPGGQEQVLSVLSQLEHGVL